MAKPLQCYIHPKGRAWMLDCHTDQTARDQVLEALIFRIQNTQALGPLYATNADSPIKKLEGFENLWESRVRHATGQYRQFFRFVDIAGQASAVFVDGTIKKARSLPRYQLEAADRRLDDYVDDLAAKPRVRDRDRARPPPPPRRD